MFSNRPSLIVENQYLLMIIHNDVIIKYSFRLNHANIVLSCSFWFSITPLVQLVERRSPKPNVEGSSPSRRVNENYVKKIFTEPLEKYLLTHIMFV